MELALGIDIGGTNTAFGIVRKDGHILLEKSVHTRSFDSAKALIRGIHEEIANTHYLSDLIGIGVGAPNGNTFTGNIENAPNLPWRGVIPLKQYFEELFELPTYLSNDANAAALGEKLFGVAKELNDFVEITLGTGLGSGVIAQGNLIVGSHGGAGEYGHIRVVPNGRLCGCGRKGCLETYVSSTGVVRSIRELDSDNRKISKLLWKENPEARDVFEYAQEGDLFAIEILDYTAEILGSALADFAAFSEPSAYVLFGGLSLSGTLFSDRVQKSMDRHLLNIYQGNIQILNSSLNELNAAILGASSTVFWEKSKSDV
ncbi:MAG: ROK family protein [Bacteroidetes bacterium]|nr:MAG: ROK family protein [Bacteroidota bacterium]